MFKAFVINLDKDTGRMEFMDKQMKLLGILYERMSAILGKEYSFGDEYIEEMAIKKGGRAMLPGEVGCAASHKRIYKRVVRENIEYTLVLEDDVVLDDDFKKRVEEEIGKNMNNNTWEYLLFDYAQPGLPFLKGRVISIYQNLRKQSFAHMPWFCLYSFLKLLYIIPLSIFEVLRDAYKKNKPGPVQFYRPLYLAGAYLVTREGARKLLQLANPIVYPADQLPNQSRIQAGLEFYAYAPLSVRQEKQVFGSSILEMSGDQL